jgi:alpha-tubulin suppressor-like RCC1 family protein
VVGLNNAVNVSCSFGTTCAALSSGSVSCWGFNEHGDLGIGSELPNQSNVPVTVVGVSNAALVDLGFDEMILTRTGSALAWGSNGFGGRVGDGTTIDRFAPVAVLNATDVTATGMGLGHACIVHSPGTASCWGDNSSGELGNGTLTTSSAPVNVVGLTNVKGIAAGSLHTCAVKTDGSVWCWGQNVGDLGDGNVNFVNQSTPIRAQL